MRPQPRDHPRRNARMLTGGSCGNAGGWVTGCGGGTDEAACWLAGPLQPTNRQMPTEKARATAGVVNLIDRTA